MKLPGKMFVKLEGEQCQDFVLMLSGEKRIFKMGDSAREITLYEIGSGDICVLNASCILSNTRLPANASTMCETEILLLPAQHFLDMIAKYEEMRAFVHFHINAGFASIMTLISEVTFGKMDKRLTDYLIEKSENAKLRKTHQQIANDLGTSREVVSRLLKDFERQGMIILSRNSIKLKNL
jgi:CRP/FNR family transcriptional regulator